MRGDDVNELERLAASFLLIECGESLPVEEVPFYRGMARVEAMMEWGRREKLVERMEKERNAVGGKASSKLTRSEETHEVRWCDDRFSRDDILLDKLLLFLSRTRSSS